MVFSVIITERVLKRAGIHLLDLLLSIHAKQSERFDLGLQSFGSNRSESEPDFFIHVQELPFGMYATVGVDYTKDTKLVLL